MYDYIHAEPLVKWRQFFLRSTNFWRIVMTGCFTNSVVTLDIYYITFSHHPPQHYDTTILSVLQHITDNYQHAQATSPTATSSLATSSQVYCTNIVIELLSRCDVLPCILLGGLYCNSAFCHLLILKTSLNEWMNFRCCKGFNRDWHRDYKIQLVANITTSNRSLLLSSVHS